MRWAPTPVPRPHRHGETEWNLLEHGSPTYLLEQGTLRRLAVLSLEA